MKDQDWRTGLRLRELGPKGRGVLAARPFGVGEVVAAFGGPRLPRSRVDDFTHVIQVADDTFLGPSGDLDDFVNHSCRPNCAVRLSGARPTLVAHRPIAAGEEITFDYSTCMIDEPEVGVCLCGAPGCRGRIQPFGDLSLREQRRLERLGLVPAFVLSRRESERRSPASPG